MLLLLRLHYSKPQAGNRTQFLLDLRALNSKRLTRALFLTTRSMCWDRTAEL